MSTNLSQNTPIYIQQFFSSSHSKKLREIKIQDRDITYLIGLGNTGFQMMHAIRGNSICTQVTAKPSAKQNLKLDTFSIQRHTDEGYVELNTNSYGDVDSILMFIMEPDKAVSSVLSFNLLQKSLGIWSRDHWTDFQITKDGLQYQRYYTKEHEKSVLPKLSNRVTVFIDGQETKPVLVQKRFNDTQLSLPQTISRQKVTEFLSIVAQLSESKQNELLSKWQAEALKALRTKQ